MVNTITDWMGCSTTFMEPPSQESLNHKMQEDNIDTELELKKFGVQVQSRIKKDITSDFVLALLQEHQKTFVIEMGTNAYYIHHLFDLIKKSTKDNQKGKQPLSQAQIDYISKLQAGTFDHYLTPIYLLGVVQRNVTKNPAFNAITKYTEPEEEEPDIKKGLASNLKAEPKNEQV